MKKTAVYGVILGLLSLLLFASFLHASTVTFNSVTVPANSTIFDPDNVLTSAQLIALGPSSRGPNFTAAPAVKALTFGAALGQTFTFSVTGGPIDWGVGSSGSFGPDGDSGRSSINSLGSISGFSAPVKLSLLGVFTTSAPTGTAPVSYDYSGGLGQSSFSPLLNQRFSLGTD